MKVLVIGLPRFADNLVAELKKFDPENQYVHLNTYYSLIDKIRFLYHIMRCDLLYSINGSIYNVKVFDMALRINKKLIIHWVGTDVVKAKRNYENKLVNKAYINKATHFCEVDWIRDELKEIGINAEPLNFVAFDGYPDENLSLPDKFSVLTYIAEKREEFYGINEIISLARSYPDISINVAGISKYHKVLPDNITLLGWVNNMNSLIGNSVVCIRFPKHDGLSGFVLESLAKARYVVYKYKFPHCNYASNYNDLAEIVLRLKDKFDNNNLNENTEGREYILRNFNKQKILTNLVEKMKRTINEK